MLDFFNKIFLKNVGGKKVNKINNREMKTVTEKILKIIFLFILNLLNY